MNDVFCVLSAINTQYGSFTYSQRFEQLLGTIESIKTHSPGSDIFLVDASFEPLLQKDIDKLKSLVTHLGFLHNHPFMRHVKTIDHSKDTNLFQPKTVGEMIGMQNILRSLKSHGKQYRRVFKLSGRYQLNDNFKTHDYDALSDKVVVSTKQHWHGRDHYKLRLWSFNHRDLDKMTRMFDEVYNHTVSRITKDNCFDIIEYCVWYFLGKFEFLVEEVELLGVEGYYGQDANWTSD